MEVIAAFMWFANSATRWNVTVLLSAGAERYEEERLPCCSISVPVSESRTATVCGQDPEQASAAMLRLLLEHQAGISNK
jgi:hypothetical protein